MWEPGFDSQQGHYIFIMALAAVWIDPRYNSNHFSINMNHVPSNLKMETACLFWLQSVLERKFEITCWKCSVFWDMIMCWVVKATWVGKCVICHKTWIFINMAVRTIILKHIEIMSFQSSRTQFIICQVSGEEYSIFILNFNKYGIFRHLTCSDTVYGYQK
jgi:hypothetical protein